MLIIELIFIQGLTFLALIFFLKKVLYSHFKKAMKRLQILNQETEKQRAELQARLGELEAHSEARKKEAEGNAAKILEAAAREAEEVRSRTLLEAREEADKLVEEARNQREEWRRQFEAESREKAVHLAADGLRYILTSRLDQIIHPFLVEDLTHELEGLDPKRLNGQGHEARVITPYALEEKQKAKLLEVLEKKTKRKIVLTNEVDRSLIAGMVLKFENAVLDGTLKGKLKEAVGYVWKAEERGKEK